MCIYDEVPETNKEPFQTRCNSVVDSGMRGTQQVFKIISTDTVTSQPEVG
jgi:hypothetical protein